MIEELIRQLLSQPAPIGSPHGAAMLVVAIIGLALTLAQLGYQLSNRPGHHGLPLQDQISNSTNGSPIQIGYGTCRPAGTIIWSTGIKYIGQTSKKGGQPGYYASFAFAFGEGPGRLTRLWGDSKFVWTNLPTSASEFPANLLPQWNATTIYNPGNEVGYNGQAYICFETNTGITPGSSPETWGVTGDFPAWDNMHAYNIGDVVTFNNQFWTNIATITSPDLPHTPPNQATTHWKVLSTYYPPPQIYQGTQTQLPNSLIQAAEGVDVTPAHRGLIYCVMENWPLQNFGNRIPNLRGEVTYTKTNNLL